MFGSIFEKFVIREKKRKKKRKLYRYIVKEVDFSCQQKCSHIIHYLICLDMQDGAWTLVFKAQILTGISPNEIYKSKGWNQGLISRTVYYFDKVIWVLDTYRTGLVNDWGKLDVQHVKQKITKMSGLYLWGKNCT